MYDAVIIGSGPNGLAAAITLARAGRSVLVLEAQDEFGGGARSAELTLPGFHHDLFSAVHPLALESEFIASLPLKDYGLEWIQSPAVLAHPLENGTAAVVYRSIETTAQALGPGGPSYQRLLKALLSDWPWVKREIFEPMGFPANPFRFARFGLGALFPASLCASLALTGTAAQAIFAGTAAHSALPLTMPSSSAFGLTLLLAAHNVGWPIPRGGAGAISRAMTAYLKALGGEMRTGFPVTNLEQLPPAKTLFFDITPRQILAIAKDQLGQAFALKLGRYRYGPGVFKMDWALSDPIPWKCPRVASAATVHLGGTMREIVASERAAWAGETCANAFVLLVQPTLFDPSRAPSGKHIAWAYCHVPHACKTDMGLAITNQIERFAPGFRDRILATSCLSPAQLEKKNGNLIGGDINGGAVDPIQLFFRPTARYYATSTKKMFICSSSSPPGGGVHGYCGFNAAKLALSTVLK